ncbi:choline O-acetyltransferase-like [Gigantopelta aegis]|uniref:choline O-acetyltransferase-like n=1 Tax=Gigantopelta aegis TaxID=1735272 RepID=UPI001B889ED3|nr:choline O-acetyltransferase-like [Gigantopelta aegis]
MDTVNNDHQRNGSNKEHDDSTEWDLSKSLPKLPVPSLQSTLNKYLTVMKPVLSPPLFAKMSYIVDQFRQDGGEGEVLQNYLLKVYEETDNWANKWWLDDMYLKIRLPLPVNSNPGIIFPKQRFTNQRQQIRYASQLVCGVLDYKSMIDSHTLPVDRVSYKEKGQPMCMRQHYDMFTSYRAPGVVKDVQMKGLGNRGHDVITVLCKNQMFAMEVTSNSATASYEKIYQQLELITKLADVDAGNAPSIGVLTSQSRDRWAESRITLQKDPSNRESLELIEQSIFILCLDDGTVPRYESSKKLDDTALALHMLHGQGTNVNTCNRWFDATMQFVVAANGSCGMNYEHSVAEGIAVVQMVDHALRYVESTQTEKSPPVSNGLEFSIPRKLTWNISTNTLKAIDVAIPNIDKIIDDLDMSVLHFEYFGREFPKSQGMSPDSFIQLALQLTYYKIHGTLVSTYESASIRRFRYGRVDNIRANSPLALEWAKAMIGEAEITDEEKFSLLQKALRWQMDNLTETILGQGIDCHLLGLKESAFELGQPVPELFTHESYKIANHFKLSTSQVPTSRKDFFVCYGPVVPDGYGVCYNPGRDNILACVTSFNSCDDTDSNFFSFTLESSLLQMRELCLKGALPASPPPSS